MNPQIWQHTFKSLAQSIYQKSDPAHDLGHILRVVRLSGHIAELEHADLNIVLPAAWLHDCMCTEKEHSFRYSSAQLSAERALEYLQQIEYPKKWFAQIYHAIKAHSYSGETSPKSIEAQVVYDADKLDALGAIGIARCFTVGGRLNRAILHNDDPFAQNRKPDDSKSALDHFSLKLFKLPALMYTTTGKSLASSRIELMEQFIVQLKIELVPDSLPIKS